MGLLNGWQNFSESKTKVEEIEMFCPRCDKDEADKVFEAPKDHAWELYRCKWCNFIWRSTEKEDTKNGASYNPSFKLDERKVSAMIDKPLIPPLRK